MIASSTGILSGAMTPSSTSCRQPSSAWAGRPSIACVGRSIGHLSSLISPIKRRKLPALISIWQKPPGCASRSSRWMPRYCATGWSSKWRRKRAPSRRRRPAHLCRERCRARCEHASVFADQVWYCNHGLHLVDNHYQSLSHPNERTYEHPSSFHSKHNFGQPFATRRLAGECRSSDGRRDRRERTTARLRG